MEGQNNPAPGWPGSPARWTSSAKSGVGTSLSAASRVWFTMSHGILNEIYYPRVDQACTRDLGIIVTDGKDYFSEEKRHARSMVTYPVPGVPAYHLTNTSLRRTLPDREGHHHRSPAGCRISSRPVSSRFTGKLTDYHLLRPPGAASRQPRRRQYRVGRRLQRRAHAFCGAQRQCPGTGMFGTWLKRSVGFVGSIRWLAGPHAA